MSTLNTAQLRVIPTAAVGFTVTTGAINTFGAWVQFIATSAINAPIAVAGFHISAYPTSGNFEIQVGVGTAGHETVVGNILHISPPTNDNVQIHMLPAPLNASIANQRLAIRIRSDQSSASVQMALLYYQSISAGTASDEAYTYLPYGNLQAGTVVAPNTSAWADSAWFEMSTSLATGSRIMGISHLWANGYTNIDWELDIATGASGSETVVTTFRSTFAPVGLQGLSNVYLPAAYTLSGAQRVSCRLRKAGSASATVSFYLIYLPASSLVPVIDSLGCGLSQNQITALGSNLDIAGTFSVFVDSVYFPSTVSSNDGEMVVLDVPDYEDGSVCVKVDGGTPVCATLSCELPQVTPASWRLHRFDMRPRTEQRS